MNFQLAYLMILSLGLSLLVHYLIIDVSHKKGIFLDNIEKIQKAHKLPIPRIGGLGIFLSSMFIIYDAEIGTGLMIASIPAFIAGFIEDYSGKVAPIQRLIIMLLSPILGVLIMYPTIALASAHHLILNGALIITAILLCVSCINGVNFIDGQNGLASSSIAVTLSSIVFIAYKLHDYSIFYIASVLLLGTIGFLIFNFPRAKIFLGDGGAYFLGFITSALTIIVYLRLAESVSILGIVTLLIYPIWEVAFSTIRKLVYDKLSPLQSDKYHLHQLLYRNQTTALPYTPTLKLMPLQITVSISSLTFIHSSLAQLLIITLYIFAYTILYITYRKKDTVRRAIKLSKKG